MKNMIKTQLIRYIAAGALLLNAAVPAFAGSFDFKDFDHYKRSSGDRIEVDIDNRADVDSDIKTTADTGYNVQKNIADVDVKGKDYKVCDKESRVSKSLREDFSKSHKEFDKSKSFDFDRFESKKCDIDRHDGKLTVDGLNELSTGFADALTRNTIVANSADAFGFDFDFLKKDDGDKHKSDGNKVEVDIDNHADINSDIVTKANTGYNTQTNKADVRTSGSGDVSVSGQNTMFTGDASAATNSTIVVNSVWSGI